MKVLIPTIVTSANYPVSPAAYGYSNLGDSPEWNIATAYIVGNKVIVDALKSEFQCVVGNTGTAPTLTGTTPWVKIGSTKAWRPFDGSVSTQVTSAANVPLVYNIIGIGRWSAVCFLNTDASYVTITHYRAEGPLSITYNLIDSTQIIDAWAYCFGDFALRRNIVIDGWDGYGSDSSSRLVITVGRNGGADLIGVGEILIGPAFRLGECQSEPKKRLVDYSKKETNAFGDITIVKRAYAYQASFDVEIETSQRGFVDRLIENLRATPSVYFPSTSTQELSIYGFPSSFEITYSTPERAYATLEIEGVT